MCVWSTINSKKCQLELDWSAQQSNQFENNSILELEDAQEPQLK
jgi:hypothetical protein